MDEYSDKAVQLIGWGSKVRNGAASDSLKRITINVFPMRYVNFSKIIELQNNDNCRQLF
jgi:hypothetical protein